MDVDEHIDELERQGRALAAAARSAGPAAPVPPCPGWTVRDLVAHTAGVHAWAAGFVRADPDADPDAELAEPPGHDVVGWYVEQHASLVAALRSAPPDLSSWTFLPAPSPLAFWARRQAHEAAVHRADAAAAAGFEVRLPNGFAVDGIDELLFAFMARAGRLHAPAPCTLLVAPDDAPARWLVTIGPEGAATRRGEGPADCAVRGPVSELYLLLWNRADGPVEGDRTVLDRWREQARVSWS